MQDIFLSYASADRERAREIAALFRARGWSVWWDRTIPPGRTYDQVIEEALDASRCVVVLWTRSSVQSDWVKIEAEEGAQRGIMVPLLLDDVRPPLAFRRIQASNLVGWKPGDPNPELDLLLDTIAERLGEAAREAPTAHAAKDTDTAAQPPAASHDSSADPAPVPSPGAAKAAPVNVIDDWVRSLLTLQPSAFLPNQDEGPIQPQQDPVPDSTSEGFPKPGESEAASPEEPRARAGRIGGFFRRNLLLLIGIVLLGWLATELIQGNLSRADSPSESVAADAAAGEIPSRMDALRGAVEFESLADRGQLTITVSDTSEGGHHRLARAKVEITADSSRFWRRISRLSGYTGVFVDDRLSPGLYFVRISHPGYRPVTGPVSVERRRITTVTAILVRN